MSTQERARRLNQIPKLIWFTGLSGSGKTTLVNALNELLEENNFVTAVLDGDAVRKTLNKDLGYSRDDRDENLRRVAEVSNLLLTSGLIVLAAFISPFQAERDRIKKIVGDENYIEVFVSTPIDTCEQRDVKGLYAKARKGLLPAFTGISSPYEVPLNPSITIDTTHSSVASDAITLFKIILPLVSFAN